MNTHPIRFGISCAQQTYEWPQLVELWETADQLGYDSLWTFDHLYPMLMPDPSGPCFEGWTTLSALSQHTSRAKLGALVNCNNFRNPALTAKMGATLDHATGGRFILGIGAGWFELEHRSLGFEFKSTPERLQALDESCRIIKSMFTQEKTTFRSKHYQVIDAYCSPKPIQRPRPPLMIAGQGENVLLRIVAEHADMWNTQGNPQRMRHLIEVMRRHGEKIGRDIDEIEKTVVIPFCYKASKERETKMAAALGRTSRDEARKQMMIGGTQECLDTIEQYVKAGVTHFMLGSVQPFELDEVRRFAQDVLSQAT
ncbi:MAG: TIGR03560 family F420-dependent LLM class oxidoreductase [Candidatus Binataceae bacterium]